MSRVGILVVLGIAGALAAGCGKGDSGRSADAMRKKQQQAAGPSSGASAVLGGSKLDPAITDARKIWHVDFESFGTQFFENMVGHGIAVRSEGPAGPTNQAALQKLLTAVMTRVNTAYLRNADGSKKPGQSFQITLTAAKPVATTTRFMNGPGVDYSRICVGSRDSACTGGTLGVETLDPGNRSVETACQLNALGTFAGRICGTNSVLNGSAGSDDAPLTVADKKYVDGSFTMGAGSTINQDARFRAINAVITDWGTAVGNVVAHEIGHSVGLDHESGTNIMIAVTNAVDLSSTTIPFGTRSKSTLTQNLGIQQ